MDRILKVANKYQLKDLIKEAINKYGNNVDLNYIDTSQIADMSWLFFNSSFDGDISKWDVSNVKYMNSMFECSSFNGDIGSWNVGKVENVVCMFRMSQFNQDISGWDIKSLDRYRISKLFRFSKFNKNLYGWVEQRPELPWYQFIENTQLLNNFFKRWVEYE